MEEEGRVCERGMFKEKYIRILLQAHCSVMKSPKRGGKTICFRSVSSSCSSSISFRPNFVGTSSQ